MKINTKIVTLKRKYVFDTHKGRFQLGLWLQISQNKGYNMS